MFLDEPSTGMDVIGRHLIWDAIQMLRATDGATVAWTSRDIKERERDRDTVMEMRRLRLVRDIIRDAPAQALVVECGS